MSAMEVSCQILEPLNPMVYNPAALEALIPLTESSGKILQASGLSVLLIMMLMKAGVLTKKIPTL